MAGVSRTALGHVRRALASVRDGRSGGVPLTQPYPGVPPNRPMAVALEASTEISELGNGVLVASEHAPGPWSTICVLVDAGPRYEHDSFLGASHFIDRLAYKSTLGRSHMDLMKTLEQLGGNFLCSSNRETMMYQGSVFQHALGEAVQLLSDVVLTPAYTEDEVHEQCILVGYELDELVNKPDIFISELLHRAAYGAGGLGNAHLCQKDHAERMTPAILHAFRNKMYTGERMVVAGSGMEHGQLLELAERHFGPARLARSALQPVINTPAEVSGCNKQQRRRHRQQQAPLFLSHLSAGALFLPLMCCLKKRGGRERCMLKKSSYWLLNSLFLLPPLPSPLSFMLLSWLGVVLGWLGALLHERVA